MADRYARVAILRYNITRLAFLSRLKQTLFGSFASRARHLLSVRIRANGPNGASKDPAIDARHRYPARVRRDTRDDRLNRYPILDAARCNVAQRAVRAKTRQTSLSRHRDTSLSLLA